MEFMNFKKFDVSAATLAEVKENLNETTFHINGDATQAYKNYVKKLGHEPSADEETKFMLNYLADKTHNCPNAGFLITRTSAVADTRERPYEFEDVKNEDGARSFSRAYVWYDVETGVEVARGTNKAEANKNMKEAFKGGYTGSVEGKIIMEVKNPKQAVFGRAHYAPSKNARNGVWTAFGIVKD